MDKRAFYVVNTAGKKIDGKKININGGDDMFYRYKMSQLQVQVVGKGKMIKTMFLNNDEVASDLHLMPQYIPAYLAYAIGAQFKYDVKKPERERAHISGEYTAQELSDYIAKMIKEVVLCPGCSLPELKMTCDAKRGLIKIKCASCGYGGEFKKCNPKFHKFVLNNPPKNVGGVENKKLKQVKVQKKEDEDEKEKEKEKEEKEDSGDSVEGETEPKEDQQGQLLELDEEEVARTEAAVKRAAEEGVEWKSDTSKEAMENRRNELVPESIKQLVVAGADSTGSEKLKGLLAKNPSDNDVVQLLSTLRTAGSIDDDEVVEAIFAFLYREGDLAKTTKAHKLLLSSILKTESSQVAFLLQLEAHLLKQGPALIKKTPVFLKLFYDMDLALEQSILKWNTLPTEDTQVRVKAKPLIEWLENASEEESD